MKAVILAGGYGTRISEESDRIPKPMIEIGGKPLIWHIMKSYSHHGINEFIICLGYRAYVIKEYFANYFLHMSDVTFDIANNTMEVHQRFAESWKVTLVDTGLETMTGGRLKRIKPYIGETFCMTYGDGLSNVDITASIAFHRKHGKLATVTAINPPGRFGVLSLCESETLVRQIHEKPSQSGNYINGGYFVLEPAALETIDDDTSSWEREPMERLSSGGQLMAFIHEGFWQPMDTLREKRYLEELWQRGTPEWKQW